MLHVDHEEGRSAFLAALAALMDVAEGLSEEDLLARATVESLAGGPLPASWPDEAVAMLGAGRMAPDERQRAEAAALAAALSVFG